MSSSEVRGTLSDGRRYRATTYALEVTAEDGRRLEQIDLQDISDVGRDHAAISLRMRDGAVRIFDIASIDEAGRLEVFLRNNLHSAQRPAPVAAPPVSQQTVRVDSGSGSSGAGVLVGALLVIVIVALVIVLLVTRVGDDDDDETPAGAPTDQPIERPTEEPTPEPTAEPDASPEANHRENLFVTVASPGHKDYGGQRHTLDVA